MTAVAKEGKKTVEILSTISMFAIDEKSDKPSFLVVASNNFHVYKKKGKSKHWQYFSHRVIETSNAQQHDKDGFDLDCLAAWHCWAILLEGALSDYQEDVDIKDKDVGLTLVVCGASHKNKVLHQTIGDIFRYLSLNLNEKSQQVVDCFEKFDVDMSAHWSDLIFKIGSEIEKSANAHASAEQQQLPLIIETMLFKRIKPILAYDSSCQLEQWLVNDKSDNQEALIKHLQAHTDGYLSDNPQQTNLHDLYLEALVAI